MKAAGSDRLQTPCRTLRKDIPSATLQSKTARGRLAVQNRTPSRGPSSSVFMAHDDAWSLDDGLPVREVFDMSMSEVSPVSLPAYPATTLSTGADGTGRSVAFAQAGS